MKFLIITIKKLPCYLLVVTVIFLFGCGSEKDNTNFFGKDNTPPIVIAVAPENGSNEQGLNTSITAVFSEKIDPSSLSDSSFKVSASGIELNGVLTYDPMMKMVIFVPSIEFPLSASISVTLSEEIQDLAGNSLADNYSWTFFTREGVWHDEVILDTSAWWSSEPKVTWTIDGGAVVAWPHYDGTTHIVHTSHFSSHSGWENGIPINAGTGDAYDLQLTTGASGDTAIIARQGSGSSRIYTNWFDAGTGLWSNGIPLDDGSFVANSNPQIAVAPHGDAIVVWQKSNGSPSPNIYGSHYNADTGIWSDELLLETGYWGAYYPKVSLSANGNAIAVWQQLEKVGTVFIDNIIANMYDSNTGQWSGEILLESSGNKANYPDVAVDKDGNAIVVWRQHDGSTNLNIYHLYANYFDFETGRWSGPTLLQAGNVNVQFPQVTFDRNGSAMVVWMDYSSRETIYAIRYDSEYNQWEMPMLLETGDAETRSPNFSYDYQGNGFAVWHQMIGAELNVFAVRYSAITKQWGEKIRLSTTEGYSPDISLDQFGRATIVWSYGNGSTGNIYARRFE